MYNIKGKATFTAQKPNGKEGKDYHSYDNDTYDSIIIEANKNGNGLALDQNGKIIPKASNHAQIEAERCERNAQRAKRYAAGLQATAKQKAIDELIEDRANEILAETGKDKALEAVLTHVADLEAKAQEARASLTEK